MTLSHSRTQRPLELFDGGHSLQNWNWELLRTAIQRVIDRDGIGRPAVLRLTIHTRGADSDAQKNLQEAQGVATAWFGGPADSSYSAGSSGNPGVTALKWASGQSAILSVSAGESGPVGGNIMLMGSRGTVYHEIGDSESRSD